MKPAAALLVLGLGGLLGVQDLPGARAPIGFSADVEATSPAKPASSVPANDELRATITAALAQRIRSDLADPSAQLTLGKLTLDRSSLRSLEARADGNVQTPGARSIPVDVVAVYDLVDGRLESVDYTARPVETALTAVDRAVRAAIGQRVGARIAEEFPNQVTTFELLEVGRIDYGRHRTRLEGTGLTDFGEEGRAFTPFVATLDKHTGELLELRYDLLQEDGTTVARR